VPLRLFGGRLRRLLTRRLSRVEVVHLVAAFVACVLVPAYSYALGEGGLAWTMFSRSDSFRLKLLATDREGNVHLLHPSELTRGAEPALRVYLQGAESFRTWPVGPTFRARLPALAKAGCESGRYRAIELALEERATLDAPVAVTRAHALCP
jgi:hypothetical protein